jgi:hypothetical protein
MVELEPDSYRRATANGVCFWSFVYTGQECETQPFEFPSYRFSHSHPLLHKEQFLP